MPEEKKIDWNGEGLPPAGIPLEMKHRHADDEWAMPGFYVETLAWVGEKRFVVAGDECVGDLDDYEFRPLRTPEQIAAEEREKQRDYALNWMTAHGSAKGENEAMWQQRLLVVREMLDMGYRRSEVEA